MNKCTNKKSHSSFTLNECAFPRLSGLGRAGVKKKGSSKDYKSICSMMGLPLCVVPHGITKAELRLPLSKRNGE